VTGSGATGTGAGWIVPAAFAQRRIDRDGVAGRDWIAALPGVVADLLTRWALRVRPEAAPRYGDYALVLPVVRVTTGEPAVLKVGWQDGTSRAEAVGLVAWGGRGAVRLLEDDPDVDPKPAAGDPELGVPELLWNRAGELRSPEDALGLLDRLVRAGGLDPDRARAWALVRSVDYWLWGLEHGLTIDPAHCARLADCLT